jgi:hypothetical protein
MHPNMNDEYLLLDGATKGFVDAAIADAKAAAGRQRRLMPSGGEAYAYRHPDGIAWGVDTREGNILRGVMPSQS